MRTIIGIDLGVKETRMAGITPAGEPQIILNHEYQPSTASAVLFSDVEVTIGNLARDAAGLTEHAFAEFLRDIESDVTHKTPHGLFSPSDLCALLMRPLLDHTKNDYGEISTVTIAIPYNLRDKARFEIIRAATLAGIHKPYLINDNTAEALYLRHTHKLKKGKYLLVRLRAGIADATVFEVAKDSLRVIHLSCVGQLGLNDLKHAMMRIVSDKIAQKVGDKLSESELMEDYCFSIHGTERIIEQLRARSLAQLTIWSTTHGGIKIEVTRKEFEERIFPLTQQLKNLVKSTLEEAGVSPRNLNGYFLSASEIDRPFWAACLSSGFEIPPLSAPESSAAMGAALHAAGKSREEDRPLMGRDELKCISVKDLAPYCVGILEIDWLTRTKRNRIIIPKGEVLPCERRFEIIADDLGRTPEIVVTTSYFAENDADQVSVLTSINPRQSKAGSKHTLTITINEDGKTSAMLRNKEGDSSYFMEANT